MINCRKCKKEFGIFESLCGSGFSWGLYRCPHCGQLHAFGIVPDEVINDKDIVVIDSP